MRSPPPTARFRFLILLLAISAAAALAQPRSPSTSFTENNDKVQSNPASRAEAGGIVVSPDSLNEKLIEGNTSLQSLVIRNSGSTVVNWQIDFFDSALKSPFPTARAYSPPRSETRRRNRGIGGFNHPPPTVPTSLKSLSGLRVLYDVFHGEADTSSRSAIVSDLISRGVLVDENSREISGGILNQYDILWITNSTIPWLAGEFTATRIWVQNFDRRRLLLEGNNNLVVATYNTLLLPLGTGVSYSVTNGVGGNTTNVFPHETTAGVDTVRLQSPKILSMAAPPASPLVDDTGKLLGIIGSG